MMRRKFLAPGLALLAIAGRIQPSAAQVPDAPDSLGADAIAFNNVWGVFFRRLYGCKDRERDPENCSPADRQLDFKTYIQARAAAKKLFGFEQDKP